MTWRVYVVCAYVCAVAYSYVHLHHKYGRTHILLAIVWPIVACALTVLRIPVWIVQHFTQDGRQLK